MMTEIRVRTAKSAGKPYKLTNAGGLYLQVCQAAAGIALQLSIQRQAEDLRTELMSDALKMALAQKKPKKVIHRSDHGCQYPGYAFGKRCQEMNVMPSMGTVGDAYHNAMAESLLVDREGTAHASTLQVTKRGQNGCLRMDRGLVRPTSASLVHRVLVSE